MFQVMLVDDEPSVLEGLAYTMPWEELEVEQVHQASSAVEALALLNRHHVDIVITDIRMPGMSGLELIQEIRRSWSGIRCIILSGHGEFEYAQEAIRMETTDYLLKPIEADELAETVRSVQGKLRAEWEQIGVYRETVHTLREHMPLLQTKTLGDLLRGQLREREKIAQKLDMLGLPFRCGEPAALLLIRLEDEFYSYGTSGLHLLEYAVCNITEEIFGKHFATWCHMDALGYLIFAIQDCEAAGAINAERQRLVERLAAQLQTSVLTYLKGAISIMISRWGMFPEEAHFIYESALSSFHKRIGGSSGLFYSMVGEAEEEETEALDELYRLPTLLNLLETGSWEAAAKKLNAVFQDLRHHFPDSREHAKETLYSLAATFSHFAHKNGKRLSDLLAAADAVPEGEEVRSIAQLREWSFRALELLKESAKNRLSDSRKSALAKIQSYIRDHLESDVSLQTIADHVHFHPVYLSKLYKQETGETLSDYINRVRMEKAVYLLKETGHKIYEISRQVGYENTYFVKLFKKQFGMTPQEFREC